MYSVVGETGETPETSTDDEQKPEDVEGTENPSGDNETPVIGEDNAGEEAADETVEDDAELPAETPAAPDSDASTMGFDDIMPMTFGLANIEVRNGENGEYTITLPDTIEETATEFVVTVTPGTGKSVTAVKYKDKNAEDFAEAVKSATTGDGENQWKISLNDAETEFANGMVIFAETEAKTYTVTVDGYNAAGIKGSVTYGIGDAEVTNNCTGSIAAVAHGSVLKLKVPVEAGYEAAVKVGNTPITADADGVYVIGEITADTTVTIEVEKTSYEVKSKVEAAAGETIEQTALDAVKVVWGAEVTSSGEEGAKTYAVPKDTDLTFTLEGLGTLKAAVFYGDSSTQTTPVEPKDGKYTISEGDVKAKGGVTVKVEVRNVGKSNITMAANTNVKSLTYKNAEGSYVAIGSGVEVEEDKTFEFKVEANEFFKVTAVTAKTTSNKDVAVKKAGEGDDTVYSFTATNENIAITVATELDQTQCYQLEMNVVGDEGSVTAAVTVADDGTEADTPVLNATLPADNPVITRNAKVKAVLTVDTHYELAETDPVKLGDTALETETEGTYVLELTKGELAALTVTTERKALETANTVTFDGSAAEHMTLAVTEVPEKVTQDEQNENKYNLAVGVKDVDFTITADGPYTPTVNYSTSNEVKPVDVEKKDGKTVYTYSLAAALLGTDDTIVITETESKKKITVLYDEEDVNVVLKQGTQTVESDAADGGVEVEVTEGASLTITASALDNCKLDEITEKIDVGDAAALEGFTKGALFHKFIVTAENNVTITITAEKLLSVQPLKDVDNNAALTLNKSKKYDVRYDGTYEAVVKSGTAPLALQKVELKKGTALVPQTTEEGGKNWSTTFKAGDTSAQITLAEGLAGAECTLLLYDSAEEGAQPVASYALKVSSVLVDKDVKINNGKDIAQTADTTVSYKVDVTKNADVNELKFEVPTGDANKDVVKTAAIVNGMLQITTGYGAGESTELKVYTGSDNAKEYIQKDGKDLTVKVTASALLEATKFQPAVKQVSSTDVSLTLSLGAKGVAAPANGKVYYEVKLTPSYVAADHADKLLETVPVQYIEKKGDAQEATIYVGAKGTAMQPQYGTGAACQYGIAVRLVHSDSEAVNGTEIAAANLKGAGKAFEKEAAKDFATKTPAYETKLSLKKGVTTVYTGQQDVIAATPQFSKETTYMVIPSASDITMGMTGDELLDVAIEDNKLVVSADSDTKLGKHTVQVMATTTAGDTMYASRATIVITVVRGVEEISLNVPTDSIYYADKAVTLKTTVDYNGSRDDANPKDSVPKSKKVEYKLVDATVTEAGLSTLESINGAAEAAVVKDGVKIDKSGKISVPKNYKVTADSKFKVLVKAADFKESTVCDLSDEITITRDYMQIAKALIVKKNGSRYDVIDADGKEVESTVLNGAQMMAFEAGLPTKTSYTQADLDNYQIKNNLTFTSGSKKAVEIDAEGKITVYAPAKKVKLTVAPADGSAADKKVNTTKVITTTIKYDDVSELGLEIAKINLADGDNTREQTFSVDKVEGAPANEAREISYNDSSTATFALALKNKNEAVWENATFFTDYKLSVKKGKVLNVYKEGGCITTLIAANDKVTTVELTYKVYNEKTTKYDSVKKTYNLVNTGFTAVMDAKTKAPKVAFRDKRSTIQSNYTTTDKTLPRWIDEDGKEQAGSRYIGFNLLSPGKDYPLDFESGKDAEGNDLYVKVDVDWSVMTAKNAETLAALAESITPQGYQKLNSNGNYGGYVQMDFDNDAVLTPGSYKLKVSVGTVDNNRDFVPAAQPAAITIKVAKDKALAFKPTTSYKISAKDNGYAVLTGKGSYDSVIFSNLQNDNVIGKAKGFENDFTKYFELTKDSSGNDILKLKDDCFKDGKLVDIPKEHLTGYVTYEAGYQYTPEASKIKGTVKITVKLEDKTKYAVTNATADLAANAVANVTVSSNKKPVTIAYALVKEADKGTWQVVVKNQQAAWTPSLAVNSSVISLQHTDAMTDKSAKVTLLVIPAGSYYEAKVASAATDEAKKAIITAYGVEIKTTIALNDLTSEKTNKRVAVDKANLTQKFTAENEERNGAASGYDATNDNYWITVPYAELYDNATAQITEIKTVEEKYQDMISFSKADGEKAFFITMNKNTFLAKVAEKEGDYYTVKTVNGNKIYTPKAFTVNAQVCYGSGETVPSDKFAFKLTMPAYPKITASEYPSDYEAAVTRITELAAEISESIADNMQKYNYYYMQKLTGAELDQSVKDHVKKHLEDHIRGYVGDDSGIDMRNIQSAMTVDNGTYKAPSTTATGFVKVTVNFTNGKKENDKQEMSVDFDVNLAPFSATANDVKTAVETFLDNAKITNKTTEASLLADLKAYMAEKVVYNTSKIRYTITAFDLVEAEVGTAGSLAVKIEIYDLTTSAKPAVVDKTGDGDKLTITALRNPTDVVDAVKAAVGVTGDSASATITALTASNNAAKTRKEVEDAAKEAIGADPYVAAFAKKEGGEEDDFTFVPAGKETAGKFSFTLLVKNEDGTELADDAGKITLTEQEISAIPNLLTLDEAETKVKAWIEANTLGEDENAGDSSNTKVLKNDVTEAVILNAMKSDAVNGVPENSLITVSLNGFKANNATVTRSGSVFCKVLLTDGGDATKTVTLKVLIPTLPQTEAQAVAVIKEAVEKAVESGAIVVTNETQNGDETVTQRIMTVAQKAAGLRPNTFDISVKADAGLTITPPSGQTAGKATITLVVKTKGAEGNGTDCEIEIAIPGEEPTEPGASEGN